MIYFPMYLDRMTLSLGSLFLMTFADYRERIALTSKSFAAEVKPGCCADDVLMLFFSIKRMIRFYNGGIAVFRGVSATPRHLGYPVERDALKMGLTFSSTGSSGQVQWASGDV